VDFKIKAENKDSVQCQTVGYSHQNHGEIQGTGKGKPRISCAETIADEYRPEKNRMALHCSIDKVLTFHMSRHTFATQICLSQGVPIESVSRMLGHRHLVTTQRYASVSNEKIIGDMKLLSARLADKSSFSETNYKSIK
jgi:hypothetical protein